MNNIVCLNTYYWKMPGPCQQDREGRVVSFLWEKKELIDLFFQKIFWFSEKHFSLGHHFEVFTRIQMQNKKAISFFTIFAYDDQGHLKEESQEIQAPFSYSSLFLAGSWERSICFFYVLRNIADASRNEVGLVVDMIKGEWASIKSVEKEKEKKFLNQLISYEDSLKNHYIHPMRLFHKPKGEGECDEQYLLQEYCPLGDLQSFLESSLLPIWKRLLLCCHVIFSLDFLHRFPKWTYPLKDIDVEVLATSHNDIKFSNYVVGKDPFFSTEAAYLIDFEFVGSSSYPGTEFYFDPQKAELCHLMEKRKKREWGDLRRLGRLLTSEFESIKEPSSSDDRLTRMIAQFTKKYGQAQDIWALGLVLIGIITSNPKHLEEFFGLKDQEKIDFSLRFLRQSVEDFSWNQEIQAIFDLIQGALSIDYAKRINAESMKKVAMKIKRKVECEQFKESSLEFLTTLFSLESA